METVNIGIAGLGCRGLESFAQTLIQQFRDRARLVAVADTNPVRARTGLELLDVKAAVHDNVADLAARRDVDAIIVASPDACHEEHARLALEHGKSVFVDKPLATTVTGCLKLIEASRRAGTLLYMGFNLRHDIVVNRIRKLVEAGAFGELFSIQAIEHYNGGRTYHSRWNRLRELSGGLFIHKGSHDFDIINYFMGTVRPARVSCFASVSVFTPDNLPFAKDPGVEPGPNCTACPYRDRCPDVCALDPSDGSITSRIFTTETAAVDGYTRDLCMYLSVKDTHDQGIALIEYENGATACHSEYFATPLTNRRYLLEGSRGHGEADLDQNLVRVMPRWSRDVVEHRLCRDTGGHGGADPTMIRDFLDCLQTGNHPRADAVDGIWSVAVGVAAELSRSEKRVVEIRELLDPELDVLKNA